MAQIDCILIPSLSRDCDTTPVVASYVAFFNDGGCGCGGWLQEEATLRIAYDPEVLAELGGTVEQLQIIHYEWEPLEWVALEDIRVDTEAHVIEVDISGWILAEHYYVVTLATPTPVEPSTWGLLKTLW